MGVSGWDVAGAVGAATGVPSLLWQVYTWRASGPKVKVKVSNCFPTYGDRVGDHHFQVTAVNVGRAATTVVAWGLRAPDKRDLVVTRPLPFSAQLPGEL